jgi:aminoglycoside phosphotransferase (APT) family kinase protein
VYLATDDPAVLGAPALIMERMPGEALPKRILRGEEFARARQVLTGQCATALAAIHQIPAREVPGISAAGGALDRVGTTIDRANGRYPVLDAALGWLRANQPPASTPAPVVLHGDFRLGNLLVDGNGLAAVLDWELLHLGDPCEDLAWLSARSWRFGGPGEVGGFGGVAELLAVYAAAGGASIEAASLRWWQMLSTLKWAVMCIEQSALYLTGREHSLELLALGRRVSESEWDLLNYLDAFAPATGAAEHPPLPERGAPYSSPSVSEIIDGVRRFLATEIEQVTTGRPQYLARVAANLLAIAGRELAATAPGDEAPAWAPGDREFPDRARLRAQVARKLGNDNPGYLA